MAAGPGTADLKETEVALKIVVFSDSHRDIKPMLDVVGKLSPDMIIHLGDHIYDAVEVERQFMDIPMEFVKGNCDLGSSAPSYKMIKVHGTKILITHGDVFGVRAGTSDLAAKGKKSGADLILYGHTHRPAVKKKKGILMMNPGSIGRFSRGSSQPSFGIVEISTSIECNTLDYQYVMDNQL